MKIGKAFVFIIGIVFLFASCVNVPEEIIGTWNFQTFDTQPQGTMTWTFQDDGNLIRIATTNDGILIDSCIYTVDKSMLKTHITISGSDPIFGYGELNGIYRIDKLKEDILIITRLRRSEDETVADYLRCEMIRKQ